MSPEVPETTAVPAGAPAASGGEAEPAGTTTAGAGGTGPAAVETIPPGGTPTEGTPPAAAPVKHPVRYHTVQKGETLTGIAEQYYGEGRFWKVIYQANRELIRNPDILREGWRLRIPYPEEVAGQETAR